MAKKKHVYLSSLLTWCIFCSNYQSSAKSLSNTKAQGAQKRQEGKRDPLTQLRLSVDPRTKVNYTLEKGEVSGYGHIGINKVSKEYGGRFSMYAAVWPLVEEYPGNR